MGLFDDLIKKPTPVPTGTGGQDPSGTGQSQQTQVGTIPQDIIQTVPTIVTTPDASQNVPLTASGEIRIEKSAEESILTEKPVILKQELPDMPASVQTVPDDDGSLLIVGEESDLTMNNSLVQEATLPTSPAQTTVEESVSTPAREDALGNQSLREIQLNRMNVEPTLSAISPQDETMLNNLFGQPVSDTAESLLPVDGTEVGTPEPVAVTEKTELFENPASFIEASLGKIDIMIAHIEETHKAKLDEAAGYKGEKEKFASLESGAYADAEKMMKEKAHAEGMKKYFMNQKNHNYESGSSVTPESVETTLTSLSVKNSIEEATTRDTKKNTHKASEKQKSAEVTE